MKILDMNSAKTKEETMPLFLNLREMWQQL